VSPSPMGSPSPVISPSPMGSSSPVISPSPMGSPSPTGSPSPSPSKSPSPKRHRHRAHSSAHQTGASHTRGPAPGSSVLGTQAGLGVASPFSQFTLSGSTQFRTRPGAGFGGLLPRITPVAGPFSSGWPRYGVRSRFTQFGTRPRLVSDSLTGSSQAAGSQAGLISLAIAFAAAAIVLGLRRARRRRSSQLPATPKSG
jgi:hypothetical protein